MFSTHYRCHKNEQKSKKEKTWLVITASSKQRMLTWLLIFLKTHPQRLNHCEENVFTHLVGNPSKERTYWSTHKHKSNYWDENVWSEVAARGNSDPLWGNLSPGQTKLATSLCTRIHHHYDLVTVVASQQMCSDLPQSVYVCVLCPKWLCQGFVMLKSCMLSYTHVQTQTQTCTHSAGHLCTFMILFGPQHCSNTSTVTQHSCDKYMHSHSHNHKHPHTTHPRDPVKSFFGRQLQKICSTVLAFYDTNADSLENQVC